MDVANPHAFGRTEGFANDLALLPEELPVLDALLEAIERECAAEFSSGFIAESPAKLRRLPKSNVPESAIYDLRKRIKATRWPTK